MLIPKNTLYIQKLSKNRQKTYIAGSFKCSISTCTDDTGRKTEIPFGVILPSADVLVDDRHIHHSQVINTSTRFGHSPSSYMAHLVGLEVHVRRGKSNALYCSTHWNTLRQLETRKPECGNEQCLNMVLLFIRLQINNHWKVELMSL